MSKSKPAPKAAPVSAEPRQPFMSREEALAGVATLDGLLLIRQLCGPSVSDDAARGLGLLD